MKSKDQLLLEEAYANVFTNRNNAILKSLIAEDLKLIDELIEEGFGDYLKKVGGAIKGGVQKATSKIKETLTGGLATTLVKAIISAVPKEELENMVNIVAKGQVPKEKADQVKGFLAQDQGGQDSQENVQEKKAWLASMLFTESNIETALQNSGILTEARSGRELQKFAKEVANKINELYPKNKKAMAAAIPKFTDSVSKYLGLPAQSQQPAEQQPAEQQPAEQQPTQSQQPAEQQPPQEPGQPEQQTQDTQQSNTSSVPAPEQQQTGGIVDKVKGAANQAISAVEEKIPTGKGLVNKVMGFVKAHPKISAAAGAALLGIVVAAFAGSAPVVAPALIAAVKGAGIAGTSSIVKQMISGEKVDLKQAGKAAAVGGALGGVGSVIASGLGNIASAVMGGGGGGGGDNQANSGGGDNQANSASSREIESTREYTADQEKWIGGRPPADPNKAFSELQEVPGSKYRVTTYKDGGQSWEAIDANSDEDLQRKTDWLKPGGERDKAISSFKRNNKALLDDMFGKK